VVDGADQRLTADGERHRQNARTVAVVEQPQPRDRLARD
jgi:hypothetical protein